MTSTVDRTVPPDAATRFRAPTYVRNVIDRERLLAVLRDGGGRQLAVIHAPAGYGKTTLAVQWLRTLQDDGATTAWLGLHRDDNDPSWFLLHLLEAVRRGLPAADEVIADLRELLEQNVEDTQAYVLSALLDQITRHDGRVVLTFDDWHLIDDPQVHRALVHLLDFAPANLSVVLTGRTRPRLPLSRFRVRGQLIEIDADRLRFDLSETRSFLVDLNGLHLDSSDVQRVSTGTDGWVAALQLVSLSLRDCADPTELISGFSGRDHSIGEYLAENVLDALPQDILDFLLATSVCDRLCGDLAGALTGRQDGQVMLEELERRDLFLRPLDAEREWFRYHHLFADYLRRRLARDHPDLGPRLHRRAAGWFAAHDLVSEAVTHALAAGDVVGAIDLVERHAMALVEHSRMVSLLGLINRLPADAVGERPGMLMAIAWANCLLQRPDAAQLALEHLRRVVPAGPAHDAVHCEADVVQACIDIYGDRIDRAEGLVARSLDRPEAYRPWVVGVGANIQSFCDIHSMRYRAARDRQRWARRFHDRTVGPFADVYGRCFDGIAAAAELDLDVARRHLADAVELARASAGRRSHAAQLASALLGELLYESGEIDEAERLLQESRELGAESGVVDFMIASYVVLARIKVHRGAGADAAALLAEGGKVATRLDLPRLEAAVAAERIRILLAGRHVAQARRVAQGMPDGSANPGGIGATIDQIRTAALAAVRSAEGDHHGAAALLEQLIDELAGQGQRRAAVTASVQLVVVLERAARCLAAERLLTELVTQVPPELLRTIVDGGPEIGVVIGRLTERPDAAGLGAVPGLARLAAAIAGGGAPDGPATGRLNAREQAILRMVDTGRSNQQIAVTLNVTVNTVKWYLKNIYTKLGAANRGQATSIARQEGWLS
jgi:serine/threonine-protein kinase PknK